MAEIDPKDIAKHELIGMHVKVVSCTDPSVVGSEGRIIDETRNTIVIETSEGKGKPAKTKTLVKEICVFSFEYKPGKRVMVDGKLLVARSEDRIKKKLKKW